MLLIQDFQIFASWTPFCESAFSRTPSIRDITFEHDSLTLTVIKIRIQKEMVVGQHLFCYRDCVSRDPIHCQTRVTFHNFAEVHFRDFLLTVSDV